MIKVLSIFLAIILLAGTSTLAACSTTQEAAVNIGGAAPDFRLKDLNGQTVSLSDFQGKAILLNFWSTTCPPCVAEMPHLQAVHQDWSGRGLVVLGINTGEDLPVVTDFIRQSEYTFPVLLDSQYAVAGKYKVQYTPTTFFVKKDGSLKNAIIGAFPDKAAIEKQLAGLIQ